MDVRVIDNGSVSYIDHMGSDLTVVNSARVSFDSESKWEVDREALSKFKSETKPPESEFKILSKKDKALIAYLAEHNHWTPFAHPQITLRIKAPISIRTQFFKHKQGFVENEVSRRYVNNTPDFYHPMWRSAPTDGAKQGSSDFLSYTDDDSIDGDYHFAITGCLLTYEKLIKRGVAPEQARFVLPQGCLTEWYWTGSLAAYSRFYRQRSETHAQWEIQQYAHAVAKIIKPLFPVSWKALRGDS